MKPTSLHHVPGNGNCKVCVERMSITHKGSVKNHKESHKNSSAHQSRITNKRTPRLTKDAYLRKLKRKKLYQISMHKKCTGCYMINRNTYAGYIDGSDT